MYFLATSICSMDNLDPVWNILGFIIKTIWFGVPILLIVLGMVDLGKAVVASKEDEVKKATKAFGKRFLYAVAVFLVVWLVTVVLNFVSELGNADQISDTTGWKDCWHKIID